MACGCGGGNNAAVMTQEQLVAAAQQRADERRELARLEAESAQAAVANASSK